MKKYINLLIIFILFIFISQFVQAEFNLTYDINSGLLDRKYKLNNDNLPLFIPEFHVKGIYVSGWAAGSEMMDNLIDLVDNSIINTMVIDIKDQDGHLSYYSNVPLATEIGANKRKIRNIQALINRLQKKGIYTIARIAVFKDMLLSSKKEDLSLWLHNSETDQTYRSNNWLDPSIKEVWDYNIMLAKEAIQIGFDEIQFDYIRYPALGNGHIQAVTPENKSKSTIINQFSQYAQNQLFDFNIPLSTDVFGLTTTVKGDLGIGQNFTEIANIINIISPMIYPSHYSEGVYGIKLPESEPYKVINRSLTDAQKKVIGNRNVNIRPWLQDFSVRHKYTYKEVLEQIKAVEDLGINEWLLWNPSSRYTKEALKQKHFR